MVNEPIKYDDELLRLASTFFGDKEYFTAHEYPSINANKNKDK
jgi:hypothetical protein